MGFRGILRIFAPLLGDNSSERKLLFSHFSSDQNDTRVHFTDVPCFNCSSSFCLEMVSTQRKSRHNNYKLSLFKHSNTKKMDFFLINVNFAHIRCVTLQLILSVCTICPSQHSVIIIRLEQRTTFSQKSEQHMPWQGVIKPSVALWVQLSALFGEFNWEL